MNQSNESTRGFLLICAHYPPNFQESLRIIRFSQLDSLMIRHSHFSMTHVSLKKVMAIHPEIRHGPPSFAASKRQRWCSGCERKLALSVESKEAFRGC